MPDRYDEIARKLMRPDGNGNHSCDSAAIAAAIRAAATEETERCLGVVKSCVTALCQEAVRIPLGEAYESGGLAGASKYNVKLCEISTATKIQYEIRAGTVPNSDSPKSATPSAPEAGTEPDECQCKHCWCVREAERERAERDQAYSLAGPSPSGVGGGADGSGPEPSTGGAGLDRGADTAGDRAESGDCVSCGFTLPAHEPGCIVFFASKPTLFDNRELFAAMERLAAAVRSAIEPAPPATTKPAEDASKESQKPNTSAERVSSDNAPAGPLTLAERARELMTAPDDITEAELEAIEKRCEAATPGPWLHRARPYGHDFVSIQRDHPTRAPILYIRWEDANVNQQDERNGEFIASARTDIPRLLAALRARDAEIERLTDAISFSEVKVRAELAESKALLARAVALLVSYRDGTRSTYRIDADVTGLLAEIEGADHG
jgi:hypothetical protein